MVWPMKNQNLRYGGFRLLCLFRSFSRPLFCRRDAGSTLLALLDTRHAIKQLGAPSLPT
jgi:hypothetical protein